MKKILFITTTVIIVLATVFVFYKQSIADISLATNTGEITGANGLFSKRIQIGQTFTPSQTAYLTSVVFNYSIIGSPPGNCYGRLFAITGTYGTDAVPTGNPLATSTPVACVDFDGSLVFPSGQNYLLQSGTNYAIEIFHDDTSATDQNAVYIFTNTQSYGGNEYVYINGYQIPFPNDDLIFTVYGVTSLDTPVSVNPYDTIIFE